MSEELHVRSRHPSLRENTIPFPHAPSISRQSLSLTSTDIESLGYSYSQAYANLSHDSNGTNQAQARLSRTPHGSIRSARGRTAAQQLSPVAEENEERRRSRGSRGSYTSSPITHRSSVPVPLAELTMALAEGPAIVGAFPEDVTEAIMSELSRVEARQAAIARQTPRRFKILRIFEPVKRVAKAAGNTISGALKSYRPFA